MIKLRLHPVAKPSLTATLIEYKFSIRASSTINKSRRDNQCLPKSLLKKPSNNDMVISATYWISLLSFGSDTKYNKDNKSTAEVNVLEHKV